MSYFNKLQVLLLQEVSTLCTGKYNMCSGCTIMIIPYNAYASAKHLNKTC